jgi:chromosome partitioning protein
MIGEVKVGKVVTIINQKGGVGKTTVTLFLGVGLSKMGKKVLFIDLDAQGNLSYTMNSPENQENTALEVLSGGSITKSIVHTKQGDLISSNPALSAMDKSLTEIGKEYLLREQIKKIKDQYDFILIDTPPSLGILTINALTASEGAIVPAQADIYSIQGIGQIYGTIKAINKYTNPDLKVYGILLNRYNPRLNISQNITHMIKETADSLDIKTFEAKIYECAAVRECEALQSNIFDYPKENKAKSHFELFLNEFLSEVD